jgi:hypothetical protein
MSLEQRSYAKSFSGASIHRRGGMESTCVWSVEPEFPSELAGLAVLTEEYHILEAEAAAKRDWNEIRTHSLGNPRTASKRQRILVFPLKNLFVARISL